ncbi:MAG: PFIG00823557: AC2 (Proteasome assembly chaperone) family, partial [uncultured Solirubrobacteraceae bacterium]
AAAAVGETTGRAQGTGPRLRLQGMERRRRGRLVSPDLRRRQPRGRALRHDRSRRVRRLPGHPPHRPPHRHALAPHRVAGFRGLRGAGPARPARPHPADRPGAGDPLARLRPDRRRSRRGPRRPARRLPGRHARRRPAHPAGAPHRPGQRRGPHGDLRPRQAELRGSDRDRRSAACRVRRRRPADRVAVGGGAALRRGGAQPQGRAGPHAQARERRRRHRGRLRARDRGRRLRAPGLACRGPRSRRAGLRRAPRAQRRRRGRHARRLRSPVRRRPGARVPALPPPARRRTAGL